MIFFLKDCNIFSGKHSVVQKPSLNPPLQVHSWWNGLEILELWKGPWSVLGEHRLTIVEEPAQEWFLTSGESFLERSLQTQ